MRATPCTQHSLRKCFTWTLKKSAMLHLVTDFLCIFGETTRKGIQGPGRQSPWIDLVGQKSRDFTGLCIPSELLNQFGVRFPKKALNNRTKAWLPGRPLQLRHKAPSQQCLKILAARGRATDQ